jgi:hypothetical protein|tara:strand:+ start:186 stop:332 length:147 start_codon:yes stop_codon:yes gene_type:complete
VSDNITNRKKINEELSDKDITKIRRLIRNEIAEMYFQLYRKRAIWSKK